MIGLRGVCAGYGEGVHHADVLLDVSLTVEPGHVVAVVGENGSGKSTLARLICGMRLPQAGTVVVDGHDVCRSPVERAAVRRQVGLVQQHASNQIVSSLVYDELAFGPRNLGLDKQEVDARVADALERCGLSGFERRGTNELSGGEQQRLAFAGVLAMHPRYLVLDEPTAQLDGRERARLRRLMLSLAHEQGLGVVLVTHDPLEALLADDLMVLRAGRVVWRGAPRALLVDESGLWGKSLPQHPLVDVVAWALKTGWNPAGSPEALVDPEQLAAWVRSEGREAAALAQTRSAKRRVSWVRYGGPGCTLTLDGVSFAYGALPAVREVSLTLEPGSLTLLAGVSGSGKSTIACLAAGLLKPDTGRVQLNGVDVAPGWVGLAFQEPERQFFKECVRAELAYAAKNRGCDPAEVERRVQEAARLARLDASLMDRDPFTLSGGQARLVALASVLTLSAPVVVLDEPTAGLDAQTRVAVHRLVHRLARGGTAVLVISHDVEEWLPQVNRAALLHDGGLAWLGRASRLGDDDEAVAALESCGLAVPLMTRFRWALGGSTEDGAGAAGRGGAL